MRVRVRCTYEIVVDLPDGSDPVFVFEENGCPGAGAAGAALGRMMEEAERDGTCWACGPAKGECKVIEVVPSPAQ